MRGRVHEFNNIMFGMFPRILQLLGNYPYGESEDVSPFVSFRFYIGKSFSDYVIINSTEPELLLKQPEFNINRLTVFYIHGYVELPTDPSQEAIISSYIKRKDTNIVLVDWSEIAGGNYYIDALPNVSKVGNLLAESIKKLVDFGLNVKLVNIAGHSLGAQVCSQTGRHIQKYSMRVSRIIGLEPAFPSFYLNNINHLKKGDADFVICLHTDAGVYGTPFGTCDVDFWANSGFRIQPGCSNRVIPLQQTPEDFCSHKRSVQLYAESITNTKAFIGLKCPNYGLYIRGFCRDNTKEEFCPFTSNTASGNHFFSTNDRPPFGKGYGLLSEQQENSL